VMHADDASRAPRAGAAPTPRRTARSRAALVDARPRRVAGGTRREGRPPRRQAAKVWGDAQACRRSIPPLAAWRPGGPSLGAPRCSTRPRMLGLEGKRVLVTGASKGIGEACARLFARLGVHVAVHFKADEAAARRLAEELRGEAFGADLSVWEEGEGLVA